MYRIREDILWKIVDGEAVIVDSDKDNYCYLNRTGTEVWRLLNEGKNKKEIVSELLKKYNNTEEVLNSDCDNIIRKLLDKNIIEIIANE